MNNVKNFVNDPSNIGDFIDIRWNIQRNIYNQIEGTLHKITEKAFCVKRNNRSKKQTEFYWVPKSAIQDGIGHIINLKYWFKLSDPFVLPWTPKESLTGEYVVDPKAIIIG